ncbi:HIRAN domain-containing protein [Lactiplantibacillus daowaiensis]|uniref:HIRAN domain-containing protein n=1 Tax=Lactiplantibacillus daowaiensis TaxID=2559918 RepID=A0ABW1RZ29_9LACO|nr:HIRAN domain-containing protein [Lactiplantibacillus daowaiensis]
MENVQVGMVVSTTDQQEYRILALVDHDQQVLAQVVATADATVKLLPITALQTIVSADGVVGAQPADVRLATVMLAGTHYIPQRDAVLARLTVGTWLLCQREPNNAHDAKAVSIWTPAHAKLGYLARTDNQAYAALLDQGHLLYGVVRKIDAAGQRVTITLFENQATQAGLPALQVRQRLAATPMQTLAAVPTTSLMTPLGDLVVKSNGRPIAYQVTALNPWLADDDRRYVTKRYLITPNWDAVTDDQLVTCVPTGPAQVVDQWTNPQEQAVILSNIDSFYVVGISAKTMTGVNDNLMADTTQTAAMYRVGKVAAHRPLSFVVSWISYGDPQAQVALQLALAYPEQAAQLPYVARTATHTEATFNQAELAALLVSGLPNQQLGLTLEPSIAPFTVEKLRRTLGDEVYHALAGYQRCVHLATGQAEVSAALLQTLIHATIYHEIVTLHYALPKLGMVNHPIYPFQLFSDFLQEKDPQSTGMLAFYNFETMDVQETPLKSIASVAVIDQPEHPQRVRAADELDWLQIFMQKWQD